MDFDPKPNQPYQSRHRIWAWLIIVALAAVGIYQAGYASGRRGYVFVPKEFKVVNRDQQPLSVDYNTLWDALKVVEEKYIDQPVDQQRVLYGAVKGAMEAVGDPYTTFFPPKELSDFQTNLKGSFDGIGAEVGKRDGNIVIVAPLDGSPAEGAGLKPKDIIAKVNGELVNGWSVEQAVDRIRGPKGSKVDLTVVREGSSKPLEFSIVRDTIRIKSVKWEIKEAGPEGQKKKIMVITLSQFGDDTSGLFRQAVNEALRQNVSGLVIDMRNNPGGYLDTAVELASEWVPAGKTVVTEAQSSGQSQIFRARGGNRLSGLKTAVLLNGGSASASEILAGALRDHGLGILIGEKSFGKGSVQELVNLPEGGAVKVTVAKWITPNGKNLNQDGLEPDIQVKINDEDAAAGKDPQMDRALEEVGK